MKTARKVALLLIVFFQMKGSIHIFGDSHALFCFCSSTESPFQANRVYPFSYHTENITKHIIFFIHWYVGATMHRVGRDGPPFINVQSSEMINGDDALFVFGEIDVRCHIGKQRDYKNRSLDEIINTLVNNYCATIVEIKKNYPASLFVVFGVIPPSDNRLLENPEFPFYGTLDDRIMMTKLLNQKLEEACKKNGLNFFNINDDYCTHDGNLDSKFVELAVHINHTYNDAIKQKLISFIHSIRANVTVYSERVPFF